MNLLDSRVVLRLRTVPDILDLAFRVCFAGNQKLYLRLVGFVLVPCLVACLLLRHFAGWSWLSVWFLAVALGSVAQGLFTVAAGQLLFAEQVSFAEVAKRYLRRLPSYGMALVLARLIAVGCAMTFYANPALITLGVFVLAMYILLWPRSLFVHEISLLEGAGPLAVFARGRRFVIRQYGAALGLLLALLAAQAGFVIGAEGLGQGVVEFVLQLGKPLGDLWKDGGSLFALAGFFASVPYVATARFLKYIDIRTRKEGWDIQLKFTAIQAAEEAGRKLAA